MTSVSVCEKNVFISKLPAALEAQRECVRTEYGSLGPRTGGVENHIELVTDPRDRLRKGAFALRKGSILSQGQSGDASREKSPTTYLEDRKIAAWIHGVHETKRPGTGI